MSIEQSVDSKLEHFGITRLRFVVLSAMLLYNRSTKEQADILGVSESCLFNWLHDNNYTLPIAVLYRIIALYFN